MIFSWIYRIAYRVFMRPVLFLFEPEKVHEWLKSIGLYLGEREWGRKLLRLTMAYEHPALEQEYLGLQFKNPVGLAGGFDKNAELTQALPAMGFGFMEVGSITGVPCPGNPKPRLWRLLKSKSILVWYGLNNRGSEEVSNRLRELEFEIPLGINIAKANLEELNPVDKGIEDYLKAYQAFEGIGHYFTINISCPNTVGGEPFAEPEEFDQLMSALNAVREEGKPMFVKFAPEMPWSQFDELLDLCVKHKVDGIICANLTKNRADHPNLNDKPEFEHGGMSGLPLRQMTNEMIAHAYRKYPNQFVIIALGGVFNAEEAYRKITLGANLVQMITGMIFEGPQVVGEINRGLAKLLKEDGHRTIKDAIGSKNKSNV